MESMECRHHHRQAQNSCGLKSTVGKRDVFFKLGISCVDLTVDLKIISKVMNGIGYPQPASNFFLEAERT